MSQDRKWMSVLRKPLGPEDEGAERWKALSPLHRASLSSRGIARTQSGFVMLDERRGTGLRRGPIGRECGGLSVSHSESLKAEPA